MDIIISEPTEHVAVSLGLSGWNQHRHRHSKVVVIVFYGIR